MILHGLNMVYKVGSYRPADSGFGADDARFLRRHGFNTIRLGIIYKGLEPQPPRRLGPARLRRGYLRSIARTEANARQAAASSRLLDFHQDLYNERFQGEGWPDWQVLDDGVPAEPQAGFPGNYIVNAGLNRAFDNFWANVVVGRPRAPGRLRRRLAPIAAEASASAAVRHGLRPAQRALARLGLQHRRCLNAHRLRDVRPHDAGAVLQRARLSTRSARSTPRR